MDLILVIAALVVAILVFAFLVKIVRAAISTAITVAVIILLLQLAFGIGPNELLRQVGRLWNYLWQLFTNS